MSTVPIVVGAVRTVPAKPKFDVQTEPQKLAAKLEYRKADLAKRGVRVITGAERVWGTVERPNQPNVIFLRDVRLVGTQAELTAFLVAVGLPTAHIQAKFVDSNMYTMANTRPNARQRAAYEVDVARKNAANKARRERAKFTLEWLEPISEAIKKMKLTAVPASRATPSPGRRGRGRTLTQHLQELGAGKVLDVTNWNKFEDKGARKKDRPKGTRKGFYEVAGLNVISYDQGKLQEALQALGKGNLVSQIQFFGGSSPRATGVPVAAAAAAVRVGGIFPTVPTVPTMPVRTTSPRPIRTSLVATPGSPTRIVGSPTRVVSAVPSLPGSVGGGFPVLPTV